jgi:hypothetical protein
MCLGVRRKPVVSPWFRFIHARLLPRWWAAMAAGELDSQVEEAVIHRAHDE